MISDQYLQTALCQHFCGELTVRRVGVGLAISSFLSDSSGDRLSAYLIEEGEGLFHLEDDGDYVPTVIARGVDVARGPRQEALARILKDGGAFLDSETLEIKTAPFTAETAVVRTVKFLTSLMRARDIELWTREAVRSTFKEDALVAIYDRFEQVAEIRESYALHPRLKDFPADIAVLPREGRKAAIFLASTTNGVNEALILHQEAELLRQKHPDDDSLFFLVLLLLEDYECSAISRPKIQRAANRIDGVFGFRGDEDAAINKLAKLIAPQFVA